ncbi:ProQ/FINO family protein [Vreelandella boliviensis]|uniref:ABC transporter substrate-binding protein n=1 Tax=Vreelandella boliviensis LC1 TaxID=1072583 RepID=A0A265DV03_9GAMM|nr:ProQ/FINO family protein [Halomonas boliviensis]EHJ91164.1 Protein proQ-like protein [Halomonas boliviensis LC1]OZT73066.1 ABC transporter substrate-binding protein [Halomonas boliviensis LC1]
MAASLMNMLDDLETRLERTQAELQALREENQRLKQQLALIDDAQVQSVPSSETATTIEPKIHSEAAPDTATLDEIALNPADAVEESPEQKAPEKKAPEKKAPEKKAPSEAAPAEVAPAEAVPVVTASEEKDDSSATAEAIKAPSPHALLNQWYERYPKAFYKGHTKPLKVGIHQELAEREEWPNKLIRRALANYVNLPRYIKAVREGAERVDLDGQPAGKVDKEAALHASEKRGDQKEARQPKKAQPKAKPVAPKPPKEAVKQAESEKSEPRKQLSMEDKLLGLQQKFKGR